MLCENSIHDSCMAQEKCANSREKAISFNPMSLWTGTSWNDAIDCEDRLLRRYVQSPYRLGRIPVDLPSLGLGRQYPERNS